MKQARKPMSHNYTKALNFKICIHTYLTAEEVLAFFFRAFDLTDYMAMCKTSRHCETHQKNLKGPTGPTGALELETCTRCQSLV